MNREECDVLLSKVIAPGFRTARIKSIPVPPVRLKISCDLIEGTVFELSGRGHDSEAHAIMGDSIPQKRVLPPRERRESAAKRRASSPMQPPAKTSSPKRPTSSKSTKTAPTRSHRRKEVETTPVPRQSATPVVEEVLPTKISEGQPLPTIRAKQGDDLIKDYQSIAESAVLMVSIHQSRTKWLVDEMFTKYWTKPSKKKGTPEASNPDIKSMSKLGPCTMVIEPQSFEVMMYTVKDPNAPAVQYRAPPPPVYYPPPTYQPQPTYVNHPTPGPPMHTRPPYTVQTPQMKQDPGRNYSTPIPSPAQQPRHSAPGNIPKQSNGTPGGPARSVSASPQQKPASASNAESEKNPVIQKLATAAASDPELKALMQVVASSMATPEQLRTFQRHLDRLNEQIAQENAAAQRAKAVSILNQSGPSSAPPPPTTSVVPPAPVPIKRDPDGPALATPAPPPALPQANSTPTVPSPRPIPQPHMAPPPSMMTPPPPRAHLPKGASVGAPVYGAPYASYPPPPPPQPIVKHIVFENLSPISSIQSSNPDRYLFPEYAVLDFSPDPRGTVILVSFFVIRKGSQIIASLTNGETTEVEKTFYKPDEEYYQPVTMRLIASNPKVLETIARAAKPLKAVQEWMDNVIKTKQKAERCFLPLRLPRESATEDGILSETGGNAVTHTSQSNKEEEKTTALASPTENGVQDMIEVDDELRDVYEQPNSLVPLLW